MCTRRRKVWKGKKEREMKSRIVLKKRGVHTVETRAGDQGAGIKSQSQSLTGKSRKKKQRGKCEESGRRDGEKRGRVEP